MLTLNFYMIDKGTQDINDEIIHTGIVVLLGVITSSR